MPESRGLFDGADVRAATFARGLARHTEHEIVCVVAGNRHSRQPVTDQLEVRTVPYRQRGHGRRWEWPLIWQLPGELTRDLARLVHHRIAQRPLPWRYCCRLPVDLLATFGLQDPSAAVIESARRSGKSSVLFLTSDQEAEVALARTTRTASESPFRSRFAIMHADLVVVQTEYQRQLVGAQTRRSTVVVRNPIEIPGTGPVLVPLERRHHVLWVGRADRDCKRADRCVELARACSEVRFVAVMNRVAARDYDWLVRHAPRNLRILERVSWERSDELFAAARAVINTSDREGFPNTFLQAARHGCPVVSLQVNPDQVLTRHQWGFCAGGDLQKMAHIVRYLWQHPQRFQYVSGAGQTYVAKHHDVRECVAGLDAALSELRPPRTVRRAA
jgi:glycosyltransferase involved in cell wall biosynthesis